MKYVWKMHKNTKIQIDTLHVERIYKTIFYVNLFYYCLQCVEACQIDSRMILSTEKYRFFFLIGFRRKKI